MSLTIIHSMFLQKVIEDLLSKNADLSDYQIVLPGKRPIVFIKNILKEKQYSGLLPQFVTIDDLLHRIANQQEICGIALWLFAYNEYQKIYPSEDFTSFLKWFPTLIKDWDDLLKFSENDRAVLEYMLDDERIKNWSENLVDEEDTALKRNLNFWRKMNVFLPVLQSKLEEKTWATSGMIHKEVRRKLEDESFKNSLIQQKERFAFIGFNAFTPVEEKLVRTLLQWDKADIYFHADNYYIKDERQESGKFIREYLKWKEFNNSREFQWISKEFESPKNIKVYEVSGNIAQTKVLPEIFSELQQTEVDSSLIFSKTAVVLLDKNLLPASLDAMSSMEKVNITMGFPLKNLAFSNAMKKLFYLHKQLQKNASTYYYADVLPILEELPYDEKDEKIIKNFNEKIEERNIVYISKSLLQELLGNLSYYNLFEKQSSQTLLENLQKLCIELKFKELDDIQYENISHFEKSFKMVTNHLKNYDFEVTIETLEVLINQLVNVETIDFQGEPLDGLQVMGLLETRLLNFENVIMLSVNEGKLPLGNSQNTYLPFDVRARFGLNTFLENDSIYAYHFYRLVQGAKNIHLLYNALSSGVNTGEKSRFITQMEMESPHSIQHIIIENTSEPINEELITIPKTQVVLEKLKEWKNSVSASHLTTYLYNPIDFYLNNILKTREVDEIEEELSQRNYGNLVHYALEFLYRKVEGKHLVMKDLLSLVAQVDEAILFAIEKLKHQPEFYEKGMNFIHKSIAKRVVEEVINLDIQLLKEGNSIEIIELEKRVNADFYLDDEREHKISFNGFIDRIDRLNGNLRIIDYKTAKAKNLSLQPKEDKMENFLASNDFKQALQLSIYAYVVLESRDFPDNEVQSGILSFAEVDKAVQNLQIYKEDSLNRTNLNTPMNSIKNIILEILNPEIPFVEKKNVTYD